MGTFNTQGITDSGRMLLAEVQAGAIFDATKLVMGSGYMPSGTTVRSITAVVTPVKELPIVKKERTNDGKAIFGGVYINTDIAADFYFREFALYARLKYIGSGGAVTYGSEILYAYGNAGDNADLMPAYSSSTTVEKQLDMVVWVGSDAQVNLTVDSSAFVTMTVFEAAVNDLGTAIDGKENRHSTAAVTLAASGWTDNTQSVTAAGVTADNTVFIAAVPASQDVYSKAGIRCVSQVAETLTFTCKSKPYTDITVNIVILGG